MFVNRRSVYLVLSQLTQSQRTTGQYVSWRARPGAAAVPSIGPLRFNSKDMSDVNGQPQDCRSSHQRPSSDPLIGSVRPWGYLPSTSSTANPTNPSWKDRESWVGRIAKCPRIPAVQNTVAATAAWDVDLRRNKDRA